MLPYHETVRNKTWSSVSNSSLSKTFALCQFEALFSPSKHCFKPEKNESKILLGQKKILVRKKMLVPKKLGLEKIWVGKNFGSEKMMDPKKNFGNNKNFLA